MFFAPLFMPDAEIVIWARPMLKCFLSASPATLPAAQAASSARAPGQALLARLPKRRVGDRRCAYDAPVAHPGPTHDYRIGEGDASVNEIGGIQLVEPATSAEA